MFPIIHPEIIFINLLTVSYKLASEKSFFYKISLKYFFLRQACGVVSCIVVVIYANFRFSRANVVVIASSELGPASNERYENSALYGPF